MKEKINPFYTLSLLQNLTTKTLAINSHFFSVIEALLMGKRGERKRVRDGKRERVTQMDRERE